MINIFDAKITERKLIARNTWEITIEHDNDEFYFNAGQYIWLITKLGRRAFSVSSTSSDPKKIKIIFRANDQSEYKSQILDKSNSSIKVRGAFGFLRVPNEDQSVFYVTGGVGIAPVLSIIRRMSEYKTRAKITLVHANHDNNDAFFTDELSSYQFIKYINVYGKISDKHIKFVKNATYYVLGSQSMVDGVSEILYKIGVPNSNIIFEENYPNTLLPHMDLNDGSIFKRAVDLSLNHIILTDPLGKIIYANKMAEETTGFSFSEMIGQTPRLWGGMANKEVYLNFWRTIKTERKPFKGEFLNQRKNGEEYEVVASVSPIKDDSGELVGFLGIEQDVTLYKKSVNDFKKLNDLMVDRELKMIELKKLMNKK